MRCAALSTYLTRPTSYWRMYVGYSQPQQIDLGTSVHWGLFLGILPKQGTMRNGVPSALPTQDYPTSVNAFSFSPGETLPTPNTMDGNPPKSRVDRFNHKYASRKGSDGNLREIILYEYSSARIKTVDRYARLHPPPDSLLPEHIYSDGKTYKLTKPCPWEIVDGAERLSAVFTEWIMGLPEGHVTQVPGLTRTQVFGLLGNGLAPPEAALALKDMLAAANA